MTPSTYILDRDILFILDSFSRNINTNFMFLPGNVLKIVDISTILGATAKIKTPIPVQANIFDLTEITNAAKFINADRSVLEFHEDRLYIYSEDKSKVFQIFYAGDGAITKPHSKDEMIADPSSGYDFEFLLTKAQMNEIKSSAKIVKNNVVSFVYEPSNPIKSKVISTVDPTSSEFHSTMTDSFISAKSNIKDITVNIDINLLKLIDNDYKVSINIADPDVNENTFARFLPQDTSRFDVTYWMSLEDSSHKTKS